LRLNADQVLLPDEVGIVTLEILREREPDPKPLAALSAQQLSGPALSAIS
jgi:hypothetical protein